MNKKQVRLTWNGSCAARAEADLAYSQLKPKKKPPKKNEKTPKQKKEPLGYHNYIGSKKWRKRRHRAIVKANRRCGICGTTQELQVRHKNYIRLGRELDRDLVVLCSGCHRNKHEKDGVCDPLTKEYLSHVF